MFELHQPGSEIYVSDGRPVGEALARTTHMGIGAHPDDLEIFAIHGILECFQKSDEWFAGVVVSDGAGSARDFEYAEYTDEQMKAVRRLEQKKAAFLGEYTAQVLLDYPSAAVKGAAKEQVVEDLVSILEVAAPRVVYTHNLADKHDTHVAVALRVISALRRLPAELRPERVVGCEVWRDLDWLPDELKVQLPSDGHPNLQAALLGVFDSQIAGGKRYDLAALGRRRAHATFNESHGIDQSSALVLGMDLMPLVLRDALDPSDMVQAMISAFHDDLRDRLRRLR